MTKIETDLSLTLLRFYEKIVPKTMLGRDERFVSALPQIRQQVGKDAGTCERGYRK